MNAAIVPGEPNTPPPDCAVTTVFKPNCTALPGLLAGIYAKAFALSDEEFQLIASSVPKQGFDRRVR